MHIRRDLLAHGLPPSPATPIITVTTATVGSHLLSTEPECSHTSVHRQPPNPPKRFTTPRCWPANSSLITRLQQLGLDPSGTLVFPLPPLLRHAAPRPIVQHGA